MCGVLGAFGPPGSRHEWLELACKSLRHRGPDDTGFWRAPAAGIAFGHTRLAIQDLSAAGHQPMASACGRFHITFNGEIYNHLDLRRELAAEVWRGHSDTETLLACFVRWGIEKTLRAATGMFAFGLFDAAENRLILARDRMGEKPMYYGYAQDTFTFASELTPLRAAPGFCLTIDKSSLALYMQCGYVPTPHSIYTSMHKLEAASWIELTPALVATRSLPSPRPYWSAFDVATAGDRTPVQIGDAEAIDGLRDVLGLAVRGQMLSDVPLGAFLSGGIDSSTVVALMQSHSSKPIRTFSIGFEENEYDESCHARLVADHLGTEHTELMVRADMVLSIIPSMPQVYDEPFADPSQLPTCIVAQLARRHVSVALSGDGGDELFGGYNRYFLGARAWPWLSHIPRTLRRSLAGGIRALSPGAWDRLAAIARPITPSRFRVRMAGDKLHKASDVLNCRDGEDMYRRLVSNSWSEPLVLDADSVSPAISWPRMSNLVHQMMLRDAVTYMPDDILVKVDRAAMSVSLETRVPMLDHRVFEFAWHLPLRMKVRNGCGKWLLRQLLYRYVPQRLVERPKMGFGVPLDRWLRGPLRGWADSLLDEARLRSEGYLDAALVRRRWQEHLSGRRNWQSQLWNILMFEAWLESS